MKIRAARPAMLSLVVLTLAAAACSTTNIDEEAETAQAPEAAAPDTGAADPEPESGTESEAEPEPGTETEAAPEPESGSESGASPEPESGADAEPADDPEAEAEPEPAPTTTTVPLVLTASDTGVTEEAILLGHPNWDIELILMAGVDLGWGDVQGHYRMEVDAINDAGGVLGRRIEMLPAPYLPIGALGQEPCTKLTQEDRVFMALGVFRPDITALCFSADNGTPILHSGGSTLLEATFAATDEPIVSLYAPTELLARGGFDALDAEGFFDGKKIAFASRDEALNHHHERYLAGLGHDTSGGIVVLTSGEIDQAGNLDEYSVLLSRWEADGVDLVINDTVAGDIMTAMHALDFEIEVVVPSPAPVVQQIMEDASGGFGFEQARQVIAIGGTDHKTLYEQGHAATVECVDRWNAARPEEVALVAVGPDNLNNMEHVVQGCSGPRLFAAVAAAATAATGGDLTHESFAAAIPEIQGLELPGIGTASLAEGKTYAQTQSHVWKWNDAAERYVSWLTFDVG